MKHFKNRLSGKYLCEIKQLPKFYPRLMVVGSILGNNSELWCVLCNVRNKLLVDKYKQA